MKETIFEQVASAASVLKLDLSAEEFALFAEDREFSKREWRLYRCCSAISAKRNSRPPFRPY